jgi:hypothetical protein
LGNLGVGLMTWVNIITILIMGNVRKDYKLKRNPGICILIPKKQELKMLTFGEIIS